MITFDSSFTRLGYADGSVDEVPINGYLRLVQIDRVGVMVMDTNGNWGIIQYQQTSFDNNIALFNYLYPFTQIGVSKTAKVEICSGILQESNSEPIILIASPGIGLFNNPTDLSYNYRFKSTPFDFAQNLFVHMQDKSDAQAFFQITTSAINAGGDRASKAAIITGDSQFSENEALVLKAKTSDATQGDGYLTLYITYSICEESWYDGVYCS